VVSASIHSVANQSDNKWESVVQIAPANKQLGPNAITKWDSNLVFGY